MPSGLSQKRSMVQPRKETVMEMAEEIGVSKEKSGEILSWLRKARALVDLRVCQAGLTSY